VTASFGGPVPYAGTAILTYAATDADTLSASWAFSGGSCSARTTQGDADQPLALAGFSGTQDFSWSEERSGCQIEVSVEASNANGTVPAYALVAYDLRDTAPDDVGFADVGEQEPGYANVNTVENPLEIQGIDGTIDAQILSDGPYFLSVFSNDAWSAWVKSATLAQGDYLALKATAPLELETETLVDVQIGSVTATWSFRTRGPDIEPDTFSIPPRTNVALAAEVLSADVSVTGFDGPIEISVPAGSGVAVFSGAGWTDWAQTAWIDEGQSFKVKTTSSDELGGQVNVAVQVGAATAIWSVTSTSSPFTPVEFATVTVPAGSTVTTPENLPFPAELAGQAITIEIFSDYPRTDLEGTGMNEGQLLLNHSPFAVAITGGEYSSPSWPAYAYAGETGQIQGKATAPSGQCRHYWVELNGQAWASWDLCTQ